jgi:hypothetical protein
MAKVPDRSGRDQAAEYDEWVANPPGVNDVPKAKCGHRDMLGYYADTVCGPCARKGHKKAMGK